ncbi:MAG: VCBS repeat-containing protein [Deltaproteobacteria bacterium]|nr:VCBS repeat-containing protein [Deltaproteobacteria bacterium]
MKRQLSPILLLSGLILTGCPTNVPDVSCIFNLPTPGRVSSTGGFNLLVTVNGSFDPAELPAVHFTSDLDGLILESGINTEGDCVIDGCPAGGRLEDAISPGTHVITAEALTPSGAAACAATVTIAANAPPALSSVTIAPATPVTGDDLSFTFEASDAEGDEVQVAASWAGPDGQTVAGETVSNINTAAGDEWTVTLTPRDGMDSGTAMSQSVTIGNTAPTAPTVVIGPDPGRENAALRCAVTDLDDLDPDGGQELTVSWSWTVDGADAGETSAVVLAEDQDAGELWECTAVVNDGTADSAPGSASTTVLDVLTVPGQAALTGLPVVNGTSLQRLGESGKISSPGDIDGDGLADFLVLENSSVTVNGMGQGTGNGHAYFFSGASVAAASGPWDTSDADADIVGPDGLRLSVAYGAGDINGDGVGDLVIGYKHVSLPNTSTGTGVYLLYGESTGLPSIVDLETDAIVVYGGGEEIGQIPCAVGDLDGDGFAELAIASPIADGITGSVYVAYGLPASFASGLNPSDLLPGFQVDGSTGGQQLGTSCAGVMDVDADGFNDLAVGAPGAGNSGNGRVLLYKGGEERWSGSLTSATADAIIDAGPSSTGGFGISLTALGDFDGDGMDDFATWATGPDGGDNGDGGVFIASGGDPGLSGALTSADLPYTIDGGGDLSFCKAQAGGDVNGDGLGDLLCGDQNASGGMNFSGTVAARVFLGSNSVPANQSFDDADLELVPGDEDDRPGAALALVPDLDGNDYAEVLIGAPDANLVLGANEQPVSAPGAVYLLDLAD